MGREVREVYLDAASAAPLHPVARQALLAALDDGWADPARTHGAGRRARLLLDAARGGVAEVLGARPDEVSFCASGTQAAQLAVLGGLAGRRRAGGRLVHSAVEHSAVLHAAERHAAAGGEAVAVPVDRTGRVDAAAFAAEVARPGTALASLMTANHEVGTTQPVDEVVHHCAQHGVPLHTDAAQSLGRAPVPAGWSLLSASAHKWGGPPGVGVLAVRTGIRWTSPLPAGGPGERGVPGFPDVPAVVAAAASLRAVAGETAEHARLRSLVDRIRVTVVARIPDVEVVGDPVDRLPHLVTFSCLYVDGEALLRELDRHGFAVSSGSACTADTLTPSHVLAAMGALTHGNVRVSLPRGTAAEDVDRFLAVLPGVVADLRAAAGVAGR
ncbi:MAG TPA: aminotransferase class V-fold PLP-dependent enzyme [Actinoplanes sp.]|nr:aminotransferase class V-fold PLP-dependent enzyme [Actinoplanes sp.]